MENRIELDGEERCIQLHVVVIREKQHFIAWAPALDLYAHGDSLEDVRQSFKEIVEIFIDDCVERGTLDGLLEELGWERVEDQWEPPELLSPGGAFQVGISIPRHAEACTC